MRIVSEEELRAVVDEDLALEAVTRAFQALADRRVEQPAPMGFDFPDVRGEVHVKGAAIRGAPVFAVKLASGFYRNPELGLPVGSGMVLVLDQRTGSPLAVFQDNAYLTEMRTAAAGALAAKLLAPERVDTLAVIGTGAQARYQLRALHRVVGIDRVQAWGPTAKNVERYCDEMSEALGLDFRAAESAPQAARDAELVVTVTPSRHPILGPNDLRSDATVVAVGSDGPAKQELDAAVVAGAGRVVVDRLSQCATLGELHHALDAGLMTPEDVHELGDVVAGRVPGRESDERIVCDLTGVGAQDAAIAEAAWERLGASG